MRLLSVSSFLFVDLVVVLLFFCFPFSFSCSFSLLSLFSLSCIFLPLCFVLFSVSPSCLPFHTFCHLIISFVNLSFLLSFCFPRAHTFRLQKNKNKLLLQKKKTRAQDIAHECKCSGPKHGLSELKNAKTCPSPPSVRIGSHSLLLHCQHSSQCRRKASITRSAPIGQRITLLRRGIEVAKRCWPPLWLTPALSPVYFATRICIVFLLRPVLHLWFLCPTVWSVRSLHRPVHRLRGRLPS
jgi:hypothetical protein